MTAFIRAEEDVVSKTEITTASIRFKERTDGRRIMQQLWWVHTVVNPGTTKRHGEWRDVECVGPDASDVEPAS